MEEAIMLLAKAINSNKGSGLALHALLLAVVKSMPAEQRAKVFAEFDQEIESLRSALADAGQDDDVSEGAENFVQALEVHRD